MNAGFIGSFIWGTVLLVNAIGPFGWYALSSKGEIYLFIGSLFFCIGLFSLKERISVDSQSQSISILIEDFSIHNVPNTFFIIQDVLIILMIPMAVKAFRIFVSSGYDMYMVRYLYANGADANSLMSTFQRLFYIHYIVGPCATACIIYDAILCIENKFWAKPLFHLVLLVLLQTMYSAGRTAIFFAMFMLFFVYAYYSQLKRSSYSMKVIKKRLKIFGIVFISIVVAITLMRNNSKDNFLLTIFETILSYFCGGSRVFDQTLQNPGAYGLDGYTFGICTFAGLLSVITTIQNYTIGRVGLFFIPSSFSSYTIAQGYVVNRVSYGLDSAMNAFPTMFYYFVRDAGVLGLIIVPLVFGRVLVRNERDFFRNRDRFSAFKYFFLLYSMVMSVCWWEPMRQEFWMTFLWGLLICRLILKPKLNIALGKK
jgi:oligosaccharide repeat unit polymerase